MEKKPTPHIVKGLIISLIIIVLSIIGNFLGPQQAQYFGYFSYLVLFAGVIWSCVNYSNQMNHSVTFGNIFAHGFKISAVVTVITIVFIFIFFLIFPEMKDRALDIARQKIAENKNMSDDQVETAMNFVKKSFMIFLVLGTMFFYMCIGLIASLIGAAASKKNPSTPFETHS